jgi:hypothetical protein
MFGPAGGGGGGGDDVADEGDWYAALVAGEHVGDWLDIIKVLPKLGTLPCRPSLSFFRGQSRPLKP